VLPVEPKPPRWLEVGAVWLGEALAVSVVDPRLLLEPPPPPPRDVAC